MELILKQPVPRRVLSTREQIILLESSKLYGSIFPPWIKPPDASEFELSGDQSLFLDDAELPLSDLQQETLHGWQRPSEALPPPNIQQPEVFPEPGPTMKSHERIDLVQDMTTDCSVVASLCAITARGEHGHSEIFSSFFYPYDYHSMQPAMSSNGKYIFRLHFNGCFRKVVIDDRLPTSRSEKTLHIMDRNNPNLLWPALIEKAYLKIRGGYDFPGSNSGTDIWVLTGWIPEQTFLQSDDTSPNSLWRRVSKAFNYGDVLITVGTGKLTLNEETDLGLVSEHDYAVIDMKEACGRQMILVKNPWSEGSVWRGDLTSNESFEEAYSESGIPTTQKEIHVASKSRRLAPGEFWMNIIDIFQSFESMYLNWNPGLFSFREDIHFSWDLAGLRSPEGSFTSNPQFEVKSEKGGIVWLLLSKHFTDFRPDSQGHYEEHRSAPRDDQGFVCLYAFDNDGEKVFLSDGAVVRGVYVDSPNTLIKLKLRPFEGYTVVISEQALPSAKFSFTLSAFSLCNLSMTKARDRYSHYVSEQGTWTSFSAGGNAGSSSYNLNPQFSIIIPSTSDISLLLESSIKDFPVHVKLIWGNGKLVSSITTRDVVGDSGEYRKGFAAAELRSVQAGIYTIICSTFEEGQLGTFNLHVGATSICTIQRIPPAQAGRFVLILSRAFFPAGSDCLRALLRTQRITRVSVVVPSRAIGSNPARESQSSLKLSIELGQGPNKRVLTVSGDDKFTSQKSGVRTKEVDINPGMADHINLWVVLQRSEQLELPTENVDDIEIHSDGVVDVGTWERADF